MTMSIHQFVGVQPNKNILMIQKNNEINYLMVVKLGIQGPPGLKFHINGGNAITVGNSAIYELDLSNLGGLISDLRFEEYSLPTRQEGNPLDSVIVDIVYIGRDLI